MAVINGSFLTPINLYKNHEKRHESLLRIEQARSEMCGAICQFLRSFLPSCSSNSICAFLNSEVTGPMFTKFLHDVEVLLLLLMHVFTRRYCIPFQNARAKSKDSQFRSVQTAPKNWLP